MTAPQSGPMAALRSLWFRDLQEDPIFINDIAVRIRAGLMLVIPLYMSFTLFNIVFGSPWVITGNMITDTYDMDIDGRILYHVEAVRRTYDYTVQTYVLFYALFEMLSGLFVFTSRLSPTIWLASWLAQHHRPVWKPLAPRFEFHHHLLGVFQPRHVCRLGQCHHCTRAIAHHLQLHAALDSCRFGVGVLRLYVDGDGAWFLRRLPVARLGCETGLD